MIDKILSEIYCMSEMFEKVVGYMQEIHDRSFKSCRFIEIVTVVALVACTGLGFCIGFFCF